MSPLRMLARPLLAAVFIRDAAHALRHPDEHVARLRRFEEAAEPTLEKVSARVPDKVTDKLPSLPSNLRMLARVHGGIMLAAGVCLAIGKAPRTSAAVLAATALPPALVNHPVRTRADRKENLGELMTRLGLIAGLFYATQDRAGQPSLAWRFGSWRDDRRAAHAAESAE
ncbi:DoxX family membrane protein [Pseudactinotalea sp. HY158]|uniref:DoxX family membrane protein n=1 Tax=Pseudactinotalea sp. HY158 TaxID=2654547 RepID=UPI00129C745B|nr:DoxX family membrane protein [Pseudactinotalea sp. HY158]QGH68868.1 DoxX family membrane protein [Pseudactinotalea sp. HY158]